MNAIQMLEITKIRCTSIYFPFCVHMKAMIYIFFLRYRIEIYSNKEVNLPLFYVKFEKIFQKYLISSLRFILCAQCFSNYLQNINKWKISNSLYQQFIYIIYIRNFKKVIKYYDLSLRGKNAVQYLSDTIHFRTLALKKAIRKKKYRTR